ncbi:hypothetical protein SADUNF_Sadunf05G0125600 [Salix dunnii]|uniref:Glycine-rich protein n=1 Tax=Salix dunnii TaxID=1413687 RepID=A0A835N3N6_9ROSI|nr:hypothetical protein SADUNF_Sadunf05G0125600 [Salix dunnii]
MFGVFEDRLEKHAVGTHTCFGFQVYFGQTELHYRVFLVLKNLEVSVNFLKKFSNLSKLSVGEKIGIGLALSDAENTDTRMFGVLKSQRSIWRLRTITDFFWAILNFIGVFFSTMFSMEKTDAYRKGSSSSKKWDGGPGGPGSGPYGGGPRGPPRGLDNVRGIDHSKFLACLWLMLWLKCWGTSSSFAVGNEM